MDQDRKCQKRSETGDHPGLSLLEDRLVEGRVGEKGVDRLRLPGEDRPQLLRPRRGLLESGQHLEVVPGEPFHEAKVIVGHLSPPAMLGG